MHGNTVIKKPLTASSNKKKTQLTSAYKYNLNLFKENIEKHARKKVLANQQFQKELSLQTLYKKPRYKK